MAAASCAARTAAVTCAAAVGARLVGYKRSRGQTACCASTAQRPFPVRGGFDIVLVQVLHRHGARTPIASLPGAPAASSPEFAALWGQCRKVSDAELGAATVKARTGANTLTSEERVFSTSETAGSYVPCRGGQLTPLGEQQLEQLGSFMRSEYLENPGGSLLELDFPSNDELKVVSTQTARTFRSAVSLLQGLFPQVPEIDVKGLVEVPRNPIEEILFANHARCDRLRQLFHEEKAEVDKALLSTSTRLQLKAALGTGSDWMTLIGAGDPLRALKGHGKPLPPNVSAKLSEDLDSCGHELVDSVMGRHSLEMRRLSSGLLLADMNEQINAAVQGRSRLRCMVRSAHDISVCGLLVALGLPAHSWPGFGSSVMVELLRERSSGSFYVRICCHDGVPQLKQVVVDVTVPLASWHETVAPLVLDETQYKLECRLPSGVPTPAVHHW